MNLTKTEQAKSELESDKEEDLENDPMPTLTPSLLGPQQLHYRSYNQ